MIEAILENTRLSLWTNQTKDGRKFMSGPLGANHKIYINFVDGADGKKPNATLTIRRRKEDEQQTGGFGGNNASGNAPF